MKETLKFLKFGLIGVVSVAAISALTVSCNKKETINNNNQEGGGSTTNPEVEQQLSKAVAAFDVTKKQDVNFTNVLASSINKNNFLEYFVETIGSGFEKEKGFAYTLETVKPKVDDATQLEVVYAISYKTATPQKKSFSFDGFKDETPIETKLQAAKDAFELTPKGDHSQVFASDIENETKLKQYFNVTPGKGFGEDKGFIYTFKSAKPKGTSSLDVVYDISYKDTKETTEVTRTLTKFKDKLVYAASTFELKEKANSGISTINPGTIKDEVTLTKYFDFVGKLDDVTYQFLQAKPSPNDNHSLEVKYELSYEGVAKQKIFVLTGFRDVNQIDYDYNNKDDFFSIALNKEHLNTIAFVTQQYNYTNHIQAGWTLNFDNKNNYELTKTGKYIIFNGEKMNVWKIKFIIEKPIKTTFQNGPYDAYFSEAGKEYHDANGGFQIAIKDGVNEIV